MDINQHSISRSRYVYDQNLTQNMFLINGLNLCEEAGSSLDGDKRIIFIGNIQKELSTTATIPAARLDTLQIMKVKMYQS